MREALRGASSQRFTVSPASIINFFLEGGLFCVCVVLFVFVVLCFCLFVYVSLTVPRSRQWYAK